MIALLWLAVSLAGLFTYITVAITGYRVGLVIAKKDGGYHDEFDFLIFSVLWPLSAVVLGLWWVCYHASHSPISWALAIADSAERRVDRSSALKAQVKDRDARIAELESELGIAS